MWCPPTPPQDENDMYIDHALAFLYDTGAVIPEQNLPAIYVKKDYKRNRIDAGFFTDGRRPLKLRKEESYYAPRSLFDRPSPAMAKIRRDLKLQRNRGIIRSIPNISIKQQVPLKPLAEPEGMAEWFIYEDMAILNVIQNLQGLPLSLMLLSPGHTPNWDLVADIVNQTSRTYRSPKQCRYRYEMVIVPREEGKLLESPKKQKKNKNPMKTPIKNNRSLRTSQIFASDNNSSFTKLTKLKFESIKNAIAKKPPQLKQVLINSNMKNPKHLSVLTEFGVLAYDIPPSPFDIAIKRHERMSKDKQKPVSSQQQIDSAHQQLQQLNQRSPQLISTALQQTMLQQPAILVQASPNSNVTACQAITASLVQQSPLQQQSRGQQTLSIAQQAGQQVLKAIVASPQNSALLTGTIQNQQLSQSNLMTTAVSVVLSTANPSTMTTVPITQTPQQIVSIQSNVLGSISSSIVTQATQGSVVQTLSSSSQLPQVVSMAQLTGTVLTSTSLPTNALGQRTQRLVNPGTMQEVVLHQRTGTQNPTVVSVSSLGQGITQAQLQQAAASGGYKLSIGTGQQVAGLVTKSIPVVGVNKNVTSPQIQFFRQQPVRQQLKVLHTGPTSQQQVGQIMQASVGQPMQVQSAQKVTMAGVSSAQTTPIVDATQSGSATSNLTLQVTGVGPQRTQFIKQVGKQNVTRQVTEADLQMIMAKRLLTQQSPKAQLISQTGQIYTPTSIHVQQTPGTGQQIATLVKTSTIGVPGSTAGTINMSTMSLSQMKGGQLKTTTVNASQRQQLSIQQQQLALQQRKSGQKISQIAQVPGKSTTIPTQFIMQNPKNAQGIVTVQQIIRQQPGQIMLGQKINRVIPVSVSAQPNTRQIQVISLHKAICDN